MNLIPATIPQFIRSLFPNLVWELPNNDKIIYLTFDDGPTPEITEWTLKTLDQFNAKATFFCIGENIEKYPHIFSKIIIQGHSIGNHTYNHLKGWTTKTTDYLSNIKQTQDVFDKQFVRDQSQISNPKFVKLFRPPYGQLKLGQIRQLSKTGYKIVMWSVLSIDWDKSVSKEKCLNNVINNVASGDIIVFHDSLKASKNMQYALPRVLDYFSKKGFVFKRIPE